MAVPGPSPGARGTTRPRRTSATAVDRPSVPAVIILADDVALPRSWTCPCAIHRDASTIHQGHHPRLRAGLVVSDATLASGTVFLSTSRDAVGSTCAPSREAAGVVGLALRPPRAAPSFAVAVHVRRPADKLAKRPLTCRTAPASLPEVRQGMRFSVPSARSERLDVGPGPPPLAHADEQAWVRRATWVGCATSTRLPGRPVVALSVEAG